MTIHETAQAAAQAVQRGWCLFPIPSGDKQRPPKGWPDLATDNPVNVQRWWADDNPTAYGIHLGRSGILVLDVDGDTGRESLGAAERDLGELPPTFTVSTPRGEHRYFTDAGDVRRSLGWRPGLDVLSGAHFVVGPHSNVTTGSYAASASAEALLPLPPRWIEALTSGAQESTHTRDTIPPITPPPNGETGDHGDDGGDGRSGVQEVFAQYPLVARHTSHQLIFTLARHVRALFPNQAQPPRDVIGELRRWWITGQQHTQRTWADTLADFTDAWRRVDLGRGALAEALRAARRAGTPLVVAEAFPDPQDAPVRLLAALVAELDRRSGGQGFFLSQAEAGLLLNVTRDRVGRWLRLFCSQGWLELIEPGSYTSHRANVYRCHFDR